MARGRLRWGIQSWALQVLTCVFVASLLSYAWLRGRLHVQQERLRLLPLIAAVEEAQQEQAQLQLAVDAFEHPLHLTRRLEEPAFRHLRFPRLSEVSWVPIHRPRDGGVPPSP